MRSSNLAAIILTFALSACQNYGAKTPDAAARSDVSNNNNPTGDNVLSMTVNGSTCSSNSYLNKPCVSVTICHTGSTTSCVTVDDILLDTGSYGLRVFKSALNGLTLSQETKNSASIAECVDFADGSSSWGPVKVASVKLGGEDPVQVPIQVMDSTFFAGHFDCGTPLVDATDAGSNGILGVGLLAQDCGTKCVNSASNGTYYACTGTTCTGTTLGLVNQVTNPVTLFPVDNNGVVIQLPSISLSGADSATGAVIFGIGTQDNNTPSGVSTYKADSESGLFKTTFNNVTMDGFLDTGSNGYFFPAPSSIPDCGDTDANFTGWYCPTSTKSLTAVNKSITGSPSGTVSFSIGNFISLYNTGKGVFPQIGGDGGDYFDFGLPFFYGRNVYIGFEGASSSIGSGPYWAY